jgi:hypothetical protein
MPIMNRREALLLFAAGCVVLRDALAQSAQTLSPEEEKLQAELNMLAQRVYSEEGIPMFLACENLAGDQPKSRVQQGSSPMNQKVVAAFHRYAAEWQRIHPDAKESDVAKIVELLANRDFVAGGGETSL